ncbi:hypothetical protein [Cupriavidus sp. D384]|uniref:hypothetical protein n=1 Tax=Cupriavidus sp. D384 TaxID=1538095 RepID=UPI00083250E9|nr:hypothetical protein [Cupriavidus sp. D384]
MIDQTETNEHTTTEAIDVATGRHQGVWVRLAPDGSGQWQVACTAVHGGKHASLAAPCEDAGQVAAQLHHCLNAVAEWDGSTQAALLAVFSRLITVAGESLGQSLASLNAGAQRALDHRREH